MIAEHDGETVTPITYNALVAAGQLKGSVTVLVAGPDCSKVAEEIAKATGVEKVLVAQSGIFKGFLPGTLY